MPSQKRVSQKRVSQKQARRMSRKQTQHGGGVGMPSEYFGLDSNRYFSVTDVEVVTPEGSAVVQEQGYPIQDGGRRGKKASPKRVSAKKSAKKASPKRVSAKKSAKKASPKRVSAKKATKKASPKRVSAKKAAMPKVKVLSSQRRKRSGIKARK